MGQSVKKTIISVFLFIFLVACASIGKDFALADANKIKNGMSRDDVIATMKGENPYSVTNDSFTYLYSAANGITGKTELRKVGIEFDDKGKVKNVPDGGYFRDALNPKYMDN